MSKEELTFEYRDEFKRKEIAKKIVRLLMDDEFSPMVLDGDWGVGKTEFCHKLINLIDCEQKERSKDIARYRCLYIDAFAEDHGDDPLLMLLGNIARFVKDKEGSNDTFGRYQKLRSASIAVAKSCLKIGGNAFVAQICKQSLDDIGEELSEAVRKSAEEGLDALVDISFRKYEEAKSNIEILKNVLADIAKDKKLIVIIDELDRCRPDFSIALLEKIKHVFNVPNVSFLLVCNVRQIKKSISHIYGKGVETPKYLDKFIKLIISLPMKIDQDCSVANIYLLKLIEENKIPNFDPVVYNFIIYLLEVNNHSLRDIENYSRYLNILKIQVGDEWGYGGYKINQILAVISSYCCCFKRTLIKSIDVDRIDVYKIIELCSLQNYRNENSLFYNIREIIDFLDPGIDYDEKFDIKRKIYFLEKVKFNDLREMRKKFVSYIMHLNFIRI